METVAKTVWWLLVAGMVLIAMPHVPFYVGMPAAIFLLVGAVNFWSD